MVKLEDGSLVQAAELLNGGGEDPDGKALKFSAVKGAAIPAFEAKSKMDDGSGRTRVYRFGFDDTNVTVHMTYTEEAAEKPAAAAAEAKANQGTASKNAQTPHSLAETAKSKPFTVEKAGFTTTSSQNKK